MVDVYDVYSCGLKVSIVTDKDMLVRATVNWYVPTLYGYAASCLPSSIRRALDVIQMNGATARLTPGPRDSPR
jgi:hypothetical protein